MLNIVLKDFAARIKHTHVPAGASKLLLLLVWDTEITGGSNWRFLNNLAVKFDLSFVLSAELNLCESDGGQHLENINQTWKWEG